jgi:hypothetical protein
MMLLILAVSVLPTTSQAQTAQETALARTLFQEGVALGDKGNWSEAADRFRRAYSLKPTAGIAFNLASALVEIGKLVEASELLEKVARDPAAAADLKSESEAKLAQLESRKAYLTLHIPNAPTEGLRIQVDGHDWPTAAVGVASPVDPGSHALEATSPPDLSAHQSVQVAEGERRELTLVLSAPLRKVVELPPPAPTAPPQPAQVPVQSSNHKDKPPLYKNWMLWTGVGVAVIAGVVTGAVLASGGDKTQSPIGGNTGTIKW